MRDNRYRASQNNGRGGSNDVMAAIRQKRKRRKMRALAVLIFIFVCAAAIAVLLSAPPYKVSAVYCEGNIRLNADTIVSAANIETGGNIFLTGLSQAKKNVESIPYIEDCKIQRDLPNRIRIVIDEKNPAGYINNGNTLTVIDDAGTVLEQIDNETDVLEIVSSKIKDEANRRGGEPEPAATADPSGSASPEPSPSASPAPSPTIDPIWGYDDDGDPIYRVDGGHYEYDEDGNRYFVNDTTPSPAPTTAPETETAAEDDMMPGLAKTANGIYIYDVPIIYGIAVSGVEPGARLNTPDDRNLTTLLGAMASMNNEGVLRRTTKIDVTSMSDVRFVIEDRLEVLIGSFENFDYKIQFLTTVINNYLSSYEELVLDFRGENLYARSADDSPRIVSTPAPSVSPTPSGDGSGENSSDDARESGSIAEPESTSNPTSSPRPSASAAPSASPRPSSTPASE